MKKAAIQLSTTAIVSIILAFVFLGLVITFTRSIFEQGQSQLDKFWATLNINQKASADNPLLFPEKITIKRGKSQDFGVRVYNKLALTLKNAIPIVYRCKNESNELIPPGRIIFVTTEADIPSGSEQGYTGKLRVSKDLLPGDYVCSIVVNASNPEYASDGYVSDLPQGQLNIKVIV